MNSHTDTPYIYDPLPFIASVNSPAVQNQSKVTPQDQIDSSLAKRTLEATDFETEYPASKKMRGRKEQPTLEMLSSIKVETLKKEEFKTLYVAAITFQSYDFVETCCAFFTRVSGDTFIFDRATNRIKITIFHGSRESLNYLTYFDKIDKDILFRPKSHFNDALIYWFIDLYAEEIIELDLRFLNHRVNDRFEKYISLCSNLKLFSLESNKITHKGIRCISDKKKLEQLTLKNCTQLKAVPSLIHLTELKKIDLSGCIQIELLPNIELLKKIEEINLSGCTNIRTFPKLTSKNLHTLILDTNLREVEKLKILLHIQTCRKKNMKKDFIKGLSFKKITEDVVEHIQSFSFEEQTLVLSSLIKFPIWYSLLYDCIQIIYLIPGDKREALENLFNLSVDLEAIQFFYEGIKEDYFLDIQTNLNNSLIEESLIKKAFIALKHGFEITNLDLVRHMIESYILNPKNQTKNSIDLETNFKNYLVSTCSELLLRHKDLIFTFFSGLREIVIKNFDPNINPEFFPIQMTIDDPIMYDYAGPIYGIQISVCRKHLETNYLEVLEKLSSLLKEYPNAILKTHFYGEDGYDGGALTKEFLVILMKKISAEWCLQFDMKEESRFEDFKKLGILLKMILDSEKKFQVGNIFSTKFFQTILSFNYHEKFSEEIAPLRQIEIGYRFLKGDQQKMVKKGLDFLKWDGELYNSSKNIFNFLLFSCFDFDIAEFLNEIIPLNTIELDFYALNTINFKNVDKKLKKYVFGIKDWLNESPDERLVLCKNLVQQMIFEDNIIRPLGCKIKNLQGLIQGLNLKPFYWNKLRGGNRAAKRFKNSIQGSLKISTGESYLVFEHISTRVKTIFLEWFTKLSKEDLSKFWQSTTGQPVPPEDDFITIRGTIQPFKIIGCSKIIEIPYDMKQEHILSYLDYLLVENAFLHA